MKSAVRAAAVPYVPYVPSSISWLVASLSFARILAVCFVHIDCISTCQRRPYDESQCTSSYERCDCVKNYIGAVWRLFENSARRRHDNFTPFFRESILLSSSATTDTVNASCPTISSLFTQIPFPAKEVTIQYHEPCAASMAKLEIARSDEAGPHKEYGAWRKCGEAAQKQ